MIESAEAEASIVVTMSEFALSSTAEDMESVLEQEIEQAQEEIEAMELSDTALQVSMDQSELEEAASALAAAEGTLQTAEAALEAAEEQYFEELEVQADDKEYLLQQEVNQLEAQEQAAQILLGSVATSLNTAANEMLSIADQVEEAAAKLYGLASSEEMSL